MTYFQFLILFLMIPITVLLVVQYLDRRKGLQTPDELSSYPGWLAVGLHVIVALVYTTPWDNYLVATQVWWYEPERVLGITLGWVPLEEYGFFILQTILTGLWFLLLTRRLRQPTRPFEPRPWYRWAAGLVLLVGWVVSLAALADGNPSWNYLGLILVWALPPILIQFLFGADILWYRRRLVLLTILTPTAFLALADRLAIQIGVWTISPEQTTGWLVAGLPFEELLFFTVTNTLIGLGLTLLMARESQSRLNLHKLPGRREIEVG